MGFEPAKPNGFRAWVLDRGASPIVSEKNGRVDPLADGLGAVEVPRSEQRRTNQREVDRHRLTAEHAVLRHRDKSEIVEIINLSGGGAMVRSDAKLKLWDRVDLVLGDDGTIECAVRWVRGSDYGLEFAHETHIDCDPATRDRLLRDVIRNSFPDVDIVEREPRPPEPSDGREKRHPLIWSGLLHHDHESCVARLRNISTKGALIECSAMLSQGAHVVLDLGNAGTIPASVSWSLTHQSGLSFDEPFDLAALAEMCPEIALKAAEPSENSGQPDRAAWAPEWGRVSIEELSQSLGG